MGKLLVLDNVTPPLVRLVAGTANVAAKLSFDVIITHGMDGTHKVGSMHYIAAALDIRTKNLTGVQKSQLFGALREKFPLPTFDVLFENRDTWNEHIHVEHNPDPEVKVV